MLIRIPEVLDQHELTLINDKLANAGSAWVDGRVTAGYQGAPVKLNQQIDERSSVAIGVSKNRVGRSRGALPFH